MPRPKLRTAALRAIVIEKALGLLEAEGIEVVTTRRVASLSGTSPPAIYEFFGDKRGLLSAVFFEGFRMLGEQLQALDETVYEAIGIVDLETLTPEIVHF